MPDAIDRWENEGGTVERMRAEITPNRVAGSLPGLGPAAAQGICAGERERPSSQSTEHR
jgi:hypothetical protein